MTKLYSTVIIFALSLASGACAPGQAHTKSFWDHKMVVEKIIVNAPAKTVFAAIRKHRNDEAPHRRLQSFDGKTAVISEDLHGVPILGKVHCLWKENEVPFKRIDFVLLSSSKFKESYGSYVLTPLNDKSKTQLELKSYLNPGMQIPMAGEITRISSARDSRARLKRIKQIAEALAAVDGQLF